MLHGLGDSHVETTRAKTIAEGILGDAAAAEEDHLMLLTVDTDDGAFDSHVTHTTTKIDMTLAHFSAVQDLDRPVVEIVVHVFRSRRGDVTELVGGRGSDWETGLRVNKGENDNNAEQFADDFVLGTAEPHLSRSCRYYTSL